MDNKNNEIAESIRKALSKPIHTEASEYVFDNYIDYCLKSYDRKDPIMNEILKGPHGDPNVIKKNANIIQAGIDLFKTVGFVFDNNRLRLKYLEDMKTPCFKMALFILDHIKRSKPRVILNNLRTLKSCLIFEDYGKLFYDQHISFEEEVAVTADVISNIRLYNNEDINEYLTMISTTNTINLYFDVFDGYETLDEYMMDDGMGKNITVEKRIPKTIDEPSKEYDEALSDCKRLDNPVQECEMYNALKRFVANGEIKLDTNNADVMTWAIRHNVIDDRFRFRDDRFASLVYGYNRCINDKK